MWSVTRCAAPVIKPTRKSGLKALKRALLPTIVMLPRMRRFSSKMGAAMPVLPGSSSPTRLGCDRYVGVRARSGQHEIDAAGVGAHPARLLQDNENTLNPWFDKARVDWVLLRPDRFVGAAGASAEAEGTLRRFCQIALGPQGVASPSQGHVLEPLGRPA